jgi:hypothetical protein
MDKHRKYIIIEIETFLLIKFKYYHFKWVIFQAVFDSYLKFVNLQVCVFIVYFRYYVFLWTKQIIYFLWINLLNSVTFLFLFQAMELVRFIDICGIVDHQCLTFLFKGLHMKKYPSLVISYKKRPQIINKS